MEDTLCWPATDVFAEVPGDYAKVDARAATASRPGANVALRSHRQQCLQQNPANRWSDAKSLRSELVPIDDDTDVLAVRLSAVRGFIAHPTFVSATIFRRFNSGPIRTLAAVLVLGVIVLFVSGFGTAAVSRRGRYQVSSRINQAKVCSP